MKEKNKFNRDFIKVINERLSEVEPLMQFLIGPRQIGKTTGVESLDLQA